MQSGKALRVLLVGPGHTVHVRRWIRGLKEKNLDLTLLSEKPSGERDMQGDAFELPGRHLPKLIRYCLGSVYAPFLFWRSRADVVHLQSIGMNVFLGLFVPSQRLLLSPWGSDVAVLRKGTIRHYLVRLVIRRAARILTTSEAMRDRLVDLFDVDPNMVQVISWGVDTKVFRPNRSVMEQAQERARWSLPRDKIVVLSNRTIGPTYRTHELVRAFARSTASSHDAHLVLVRGFTPGNEKARKAQDVYIEQLRDMVSDLRESVTLLEQPIPVPDMASLLRASDIVVAIPLNDQRSSSALEAIASGKRVILSDIAPNREIAAEGAVVTLVGDPVEDELCRELAEPTLLDDESLRANLAFIEKFESWHNQLDRIVQVYTEVASEA